LARVGDAKGERWLELSHVGVDVGRRTREAEATSRETKSGVGEVVVISGKYRMRRKERGARET
jgi:hypothetical protein